MVRFQILATLIFGMLAQDVAAKSLVFFSPNIRSIVLKMIAAERKSIRLAMYAFTDHIIAQALIDAKRRGVKIECVFDPFSVGYRAPKALFQDGVDVDIYNPYKGRVKKQNLDEYSNDPLMHNKFGIFQNTQLDGINGDNRGPLVVTGSYNWTLSATHKHQENAIVCNEEAVIASFVRQFGKLQEMSHDATYRHFCNARPIFFNSKSR